jgi:hypothetical protein
MSFTITLRCPRHPTYTAKIRPSTDCACCQLMFVARNTFHKAISVPLEERTDPDEKIMYAIGQP